MTTGRINQVDTFGRRERTGLTPRSRQGTAASATGLMLEAPGEAPVSESPPWRGSRWAFPRGKLIDREWGRALGPPSESLSGSESAVWPTGRAGPSDAGLRFFFKNFSPRAPPLGRPPGRRVAGFPSARARPGTRRSPPQAHRWDYKGATGPAKLPMIRRSRQLPPERSSTSRFQLRWGVGRPARARRLEGTPDR